jgi:hypothetical protein
MGNTGHKDFHVLLDGYLNESLTPEELQIFLELTARPENALLLQQSFEKDLHADSENISDLQQAKDAWLKLSSKMNAGRPYRPGSKNPE